MTEFNPSYTIERKTKRILELKKELDNRKRNLIFPYSFNGFFVCYIIFFGQRYFDYTITTFTSPKNTISTLHILDLVVIILLAFSCLIVYSSTIKLNKVKSSYESLRKDIIKMINTEFCSCNKSCNCKDEYIRGMEKEGIDLIF